MGQCYGKVKRNTQRGRRRGRQFKHKRFDFTPKRSWRYKDAHLKTEFDNMALRNDSAIFDEEEEEGDDSLVVANRLASDSEEEINTGEVRQSGRLVFSEEDEEEGESEDEPEDDSHLQVTSARPRTSSAESEKVGRFEVVVVGQSSVCSEEEEVEREEGGERVPVSEKETAILIANAVT